MTRQQLVGEVDHPGPVHGFVGTSVGEGAVQLWFHVVTRAVAPRLAIVVERIIVTIGKRPEQAQRQPEKVRGVTCTQAETVVQGGCFRCCLELSRAHRPRQFGQSIRRRQPFLSSCYIRRRGRSRRTKWRVGQLLVRLEAGLGQPSRQRARPIIHPQPVISPAIMSQELVVQVRLRVVGTTEGKVGERFGREGFCDDVDAAAGVAALLIRREGFRHDHFVDDLRREQIQRRRATIRVGRGNLRAVERGGHVAVTEAADDGELAVHDCGTGNLVDDRAGVRDACLGNLLRAK